MTKRPRRRANAVTRGLTGGGVLGWAHETGKDQMAAEIGTLVCDMINRGATDTEVVDAVREAVIARLEVGLLLPEGFA